MAKLENLEGNITIELLLTSKEHPGIIEPTSNYESWVEFQFNIEVNGQKTKTNELASVSMNLGEIQNFLAGIRCQCANMRSGLLHSFQFSNCEALFELKFTNLLEDSLIEIEVWINSGTESLGRTYGFDKGLRFLSNEEKLSRFMRVLDSELAEIFA